MYPAPQIRNNHLCASIAKLANATCSSSFKLFAWSIANFIVSFSSFDNFRFPLSKKYFDSFFHLFSVMLSSFLLFNSLHACSELSFFQILVITANSTKHFLLCIIFVSIYYHINKYYSIKICISLINISRHILSLSIVYKISILFA